MIVRIATEGQYELDDTERDSLDELDDQAIAACNGTDEARFRESFNRLLDFVRQTGSRLPEDDLRGSDVILPPPDASQEEARAEFSGEGLIPD